MVPTGRWQPSRACTNPCPAVRVRIHTDTCCIANAANMCQIANQMEDPFKFIPVEAICSDTLKSCRT